MHRVVLHSVVCLAAFSSMLAPVKAQIPNIGQTYEFGRQNAQTIEDSLGGVENAPKSGVAPRIADFTYTISSSRTRQNLKNFVARTRTVNPGAAEQLQQMFNSIDVMTEIDKAITKLGLNRNNVADAYAVYWVDAWQAVNGKTDVPEGRVYQAVAKQAAAGLSRSPSFTTLNNAQKQEMAEIYLIQAALVSIAVHQSASNPEQLKAVGKATLQGARKSGFNLDIVELKSDGFHLKTE